MTDSTIEIEQLTAPKNASSVDLALAVYAELEKRKTPSPKRDALIELFETMYFASLKTEESKPLAFHIVYIDAENPDPKPPRYPPMDRWSCTKLEAPLSLHDRSFLKLAGASDPRTSSLAVCQDSTGRLVVWGLIDQGNRYHDYVNFDSEFGPERPGLFQASIVGVGHLAAYIGYEKVAELKVNSLVRSSIDVWKGGPVRHIFDRGITAYSKKIRNTLSEEFEGDLPQVESSVTYVLLASIRRILLRIQNIRHGGALLITPDASFQGLSVKHKMQYRRLRSTLTHYTILQVRRDLASEVIMEDFVEKDADNLPVSLYLDETVADNDLESSQSELDGTIWFISLLTRVDGLVLLNPKLEVEGFGVEITVPEEPKEVFMAKDRLATQEKLLKIDYATYGTRHRSMMRYCAKVPGSLGFVISQDGDVRAITTTEGRLVIWENIRLQLPRFVQRIKRGSSKHRRTSR